VLNAARRLRVLARVTAQSVPTTSSNSADVVRKSRLHAGVGWDVMSGRRVGISARAVVADLVVRSRLRALDEAGVETSVATRGRVAVSSCIPSCYAARVRVGWAEALIATDGDVYPSPGGLKHAGAGCDSAAAFDDRAHI